MCLHTDVSESVVAATTQWQLPLRCAFQVPAVSTQIFEGHLMMLNLHTWRRRDGTPSWHDGGAPLSPNVSIRTFPWHCLAFATCSMSLTDGRKRPGLIVGSWALLCYESFHGECLRAAVCLVCSTLGLRSKPESKCIKASRPCRVSWSLGCAN